MLPNPTPRAALEIDDLNPTNVLKQTYRTVVLIYASFTSSLLVYIGIGEALIWEYAPFTGFAPLSQAALLRLRLLFTMTSLSIAVGAKPLQGLLSARPLPAGFSEQARLTAPLAVRLRAAIITFALLESMALLGLILFLFNGQRVDLYGFVAFAALLSLLHFPRYTDWETWFREQTLQ